jgi:meso-butanediol dehydrogenase / (S,S)-butanediol dehydrogenase / diacetyl reductase
MTAKRVVITGGSSGMGRAEVNKFIASGCSVVFVDINREMAGEVLSEHEKEAASGRLHFFHGDISKETDVIALLKLTESKIGGCDVLINNAGIFRGGKIHEVKEADWDAVFNVNVKAIYFMCKHFIPQMLERKYGVVINTGSVSGLFGDYDAVAYNATKGAVVNMSRAMALDYADKGIRVNAICPGATATPMFLANPPEVISMFENAFPMKRICTPEDVADTVYFLASDEAGFITGQCIVVDGGMSAHTGQPKQ